MAASSQADTILDCGSPPDQPEEPEDAEEPEEVESNPVVSGGARGHPVEGGEGDCGAVLPHPSRGGPKLHGPGQPDMTKLSWMRWSGSAGT